MKEKTKSYIKDLLRDADIDIQQFDDGTFWIHQGSTIVYITVADFGEDDSKVMFYSNVVIDANHDMDLYKKLLEINDRFSFGGFGINDNLITFNYTILGGKHLDKDEFFNALIIVAEVADDYDDKIISTHGGKTAVTKIREDIDKKERKSLFSW